MAHQHRPPASGTRPRLPPSRDDPAAAVWGPRTAATGCTASRRSGRRAPVEIRPPFRATQESSAFHPCCCASNNRRQAHTPHVPYHDPAASAPASGRNTQQQLDVFQSRSGTNRTSLPNAPNAAQGLVTLIRRIYRRFRAPTPTRSENTPSHRTCASIQPPAAWPAEGHSAPYNPQTALQTPSPAHFGRRSLTSARQVHCVVVQPFLDSFVPPVP